ncbi:MAG: hypothetical protein JRI23_11230 [Deltaproteobacteria bacterium]|nr:hypothetical protein [Deltaproteobacteria bacterium]MBW2532267.1 hypothetical protein [Deltaproteobacteria bacterium]
MTRPARKHENRPLRPRPLAALLALAAGCNAPEPPASTGGTDVPPGACGRGTAVVGTDYQSTNVSLVGVEGQVLSSSFLSSATSSAGLAAPLSGDVAAPTMLAAGAEILLLDRYPAAVLTWVDVASATVRAQLNVSTGFAANPQDYAKISTNKAYVSRYESNPAGGSEPFDAGSDLLIVDPTEPAVRGRVDLRGALEPAEAGFQPHPNRLVLIDGFAFVLLAAYSADYVQSAPSRIVTIDAATDQILGATRLEGLHGCAGLMVHPDGAELAVTCSGQFGGTTTPTLDSSALVVLAVDRSGGAPSPPTLTETARIYAADLTAAPLGFTVDFAPSGRILTTAMGQFGIAGAPDQPDQLLEVDPATGETRVLRTGESLPFELGEVRCTLPCDSCFAADAERGVLARYEPGADGWLALADEIVVDTAIGLPPRGLGRF